MAAHFLASGESSISQRGREEEGERGRGGEVLGKLGGEWKGRLKVVLSGQEEA